MIPPFIHDKPNRNLHKLPLGGGHLKRCHSEGDSSLGELHNKSYYEDTEVLSGCLPVFKHGGSTGTIDELLGATCVELNVIVEIVRLRNMDCCDSFWNQVVAGTEACATISLTEDELQTLRCVPRNSFNKCSSQGSYCNAKHLNRPEIYV